MGKTKDLGHLAHIVEYDASNNITLPANLTVTGTITGYATTASLSSYVPTFRTITINGTSFDLSADRSWTITAGISSVSGTSPINVSTTSGAATVSISQANTSTNGFLSSTDWNTFNGKQNALTIGNIVSNDTSLITVTGGTGAIIGSGVSLLVLPSAIVASGISSTLVTTALGYTPVTNARTITINGTAYDLSANRSWTVTASETDTLATVTARGASTSTALTLSGRVTFASAVSDRPQIPGGLLGLDTGDGNFDIWGISRDYYPSNPTTANAWGLRWNGTNNDFEFVGGGVSRVILDMDSGNVTTGLLIAQGPGGNYNENVRLPGSTAVISFNTTGLTGAGSYNIVSQTNFQIRNAGGTQVFILDQSGNLTMSGTVTAPTFSGALSGNATTATNVAWSGVTSKPSHIMYYQSFTLDANTMDVNATGFTYSVNAPYTGPIVRFSAGGSYDLQINANYGNGTNIAYRTRNGDAGTWNSWYALISTANIGSQKVDGSMKLWAVTHPNDYYMVHNWTGSHWYLTVNHPSPVRVGYADNSGTTSQTNFSDLSITGAAHKYLTINPGNGYEAMVRYIGGSGSSWYVGKRTSGQLVGTQSFHFYSEEAGATVGGIDPGGSMFAIGSMRSPIFYDSNDTGYYLDPNSESNLYRFTATTMTRNAINYLSINSPFTTRAAQGTPYLNGTIGWGQIDFNTVFSNWGSGFIDTWSNPGNAPGGSSHYVGLQGCHYNHQNSTNVYGFQMACAGEADNRFFWRSAWPSIRGWVEMVHSGNILSFSTSGNSANTIVRRDGSGDIGIGTLNTNHAYFGGGGRGLTSADSYGSYGNVHTYGTGMNGYSGYGIYDNAGYRSFFMFNSGSGGIYMQDWGKWAFYFSASTQSYSIGSADAIAGYTLYLIYGLYTVGLYNASDARMKKNVSSLSSSLDKVKALRGVSYEYIDNGPNGTKNKGVQLGFIAQEVLPVIPELVRYDEKKGYAMNYNGVSAVLVEAVKEQQIQIENQQNQINSLILQLTELLNK